MLVKLKETLQKFLPRGVVVEKDESFAPLIEIFRLESNPTDGTFGVIRINGRVFSVCLERPWLKNKKNISCIPAGVYLLKRELSHEWGWTYEVVDVEGRTLIRFHWGNWLTDSKGRILIGEGFGVVSGETRYPEGKRGITNSQNTFRRFIKQLNGAKWCRPIIHEVP